MSGAFESPDRVEQLASPAIPDELLARPQWVAWWSLVGEDCRILLPGGRMTGILKRQPKPHKLPIDPHTGYLAATTRRQTWSSIEDARGAAQRWSLTGIGFVFDVKDPYVGIDLDNCRDPQTGTIADWAWKIIRVLNSYTEISPSGTGVHIIIRGCLPKGKGKRKALPGGGIEMYSQGRYFTFTGNLVDGAPVAIQNRESELLALHEKLFGEKKALDTATAAPTALRPLFPDDELILLCYKQTI